MRCACDFRWQSGAAGTRPVASESRKRIAFTVGGEELGGGNGDGSPEVFYLLTPIITAQGTTTLSFFTGASNMPVTAATPAPSPTRDRLPAKVASASHSLWAVRSWAAATAMRLRLSLA